MTDDSREKGMFGFLSRKKKESQPEDLEKIAERKNSRDIPDIVDQDLDGLMKRIGISSREKEQEKNNRSMPDREVAEINSLSGSSNAGNMVLEREVERETPGGRHSTRRKEIPTLHSRDRTSQRGKKKHSPYPLVPPSRSDRRKRAFETRRENR